MLNTILTDPTRPENLILLLAGLATYLAFANVVTFAAFGFDKAQAQAQGRRIPETRLLLLATLGGWIGAKLAQHLFRHKTRKQPFRTALNLSVLVLPVLAGTPVLLAKGPDWVMAQVAAYSASYANAAQTEQTSPQTSPLGAASHQGKGAATTSDTAELAAAEPAVPQKALPTRIGPGSTGKAKPSQKTLSIGN